MLDKESSEKLQAAVLERLTKNLSADSEMDKFVQSIMRLATLAAVTALEEYEKLNQ